MVQGPGQALSLCFFSVLSFFYRSTVTPEEIPTHRHAVTCLASQSSWDRAHWCGCSPPAAGRVPEPHRTPPAGNWGKGTVSSKLQLLVQSGPMCSSTYMQWAAAVCCHTSARDTVIRRGGSVHCSTAYSSQDMEATWMPTDKWMHKGVVVRVYSETVVSHKKEQIWVSCTEMMNLKPVIQSEVHQKNKHHLLMHIYGI